MMTVYLMIQTTENISVISVRKLMHKENGKRTDEEPLCPMVRSGKYPMSPYWKKIMDTQSKGDRKGKGGSSKGSSKGTGGTRDPTSGRFKPRHSTFVVGSASNSSEAIPAEQMWPTTQLPDLETLPTVL